MHEGDSLCKSVYPDRTFSNLKDLKSFCSSETSLGGFSGSKIVEGPIGNAQCYSSCQSNIHSQGETRQQQQQHESNLWLVINLRVDKIRTPLQTVESLWWINRGKWVCTAALCALKYPCNSSRIDLASTCLLYVINALNITPFKVVRLRL